MKTMAFVATVALIIGMGLGWRFAPGRYRHHYRTGRTISLVDASGRELGVIPAGSPLLSDVRLYEAADLGWWGYVPVYFGTMTEAKALGVEPGQQVSSIMDIKLNAAEAARGMPVKP